MMAKRKKGLSLSDATVVPVLKEKLLGLVKLIVDDDDDDDDFTIETADADEAIATLSLLKNYFKQKKKKQHHRSSQPLPSLPTELITDILLKLPVRPLLQFRCLCKQWNSIISDTHFSKLHLSTSNHHRVLLYNESARPPLSVSYSVESLFNDPLIPPEYLTSKKFDLIVGTCDGLLCLFTKNSIDTRVRLWNPSTRLTSRASPSMFYYGDDIFYYGFGYDCVSGKYKVLLSFYDYITSGLVTKVYAFGDRSWRIPTQNFNYLGGYPGNKLGSFVSGTLNWVIRDYDNESNIIYSFDLEKEIFGQVSLPDDNFINPKQATLKNCLCVYDHNPTHFVVWIMKDYGVKESWTKLMVIPNVKWKVGHDFYANVKPLFVSDSGQIILNCDVRILVYNPKDVCLKYPNIQRNMKWFSQQHIYLESLVSPCF